MERRRSDFVANAREVQSFERAAFVAAIDRVIVLQSLDRHDGMRRPTSLRRKLIRGSRPENSLRQRHPNRLGRFGLGVAAACIARVSERTVPAQQARINRW